MKIKRIYTQYPIQSQNYVTTLDTKDFKLEYISDLHSYLINGITIIPAGNIKEVVIEVTEKKSKQEAK